MPTHTAYTVVREVFVDQSLVGIIVGSQGAHVERIEHQFAVHIEVEKASAGGDKRKITVSGKNESSVEDAIQ